MMLGWDGHRGGPSIHRGVRECPRGADLRWSLRHSGKTQPEEFRPSMTRGACFQDWKSNGFTPTGAAMHATCQPEPFGPAAAPIKVMRATAARGEWPTAPNCRLAPTLQCPECDRPAPRNFHSRSRGRSSRHRLNLGRHISGFSGCSGPPPHTAWRRCRTG